MNYEQLQEYLLLEAEGETEEGHPLSPRQLTFKQCDKKTAIEYNKKWHSRVPEIPNASFLSQAYCAEYKGQVYAIALWSYPIARAFNNKGYFELRRMAIAPNAPKFTASSMIAWMAKDIYKTRPNIVKLISYQDTDTHDGTIYKAAGWVEAGKSKGQKQKGNGLNQTPGKDTESSIKIRWERDIRKQPVSSEILAKRQSFKDFYYAKKQVEKEAQSKAA